MLWLSACVRGVGAKGQLSRGVVASSLHSLVGRRGDVDRLDGENINAGKSQGDVQPELDAGEGSGVGRHACVDKGRPREEDDDQRRTRCLRLALRCSLNGDRVASLKLVQDDVLSSLVRVDCKLVQDVRHEDGVAPAGEAKP